MKYKNGDTLTCKKDFVSLGIYKKDKIYKITQDHLLDKIWLQAENHGEPHIFSDGRSVPQIMGQWFSVVEIEENNWDKYLFDHFYTNNELRKLKLEKLYKNC